MGVNCFIDKFFNMYYKFKWLVLNLYMYNCRKGKKNIYLRDS